VNNRMMQM